METLFDLIATCGPHPSMICSYNSHSLIVMAVTSLPVLLLLRHWIEEEKIYPQLGIRDASFGVDDSENTKT